jgi:hypothetical protein
MDGEASEHERAERLLDQAEREIEAIRQTLVTGGKSPPAPRPLASPPSAPPARVSLQKRLASLPEVAED